MSSSTSISATRCRRSNSLRLKGRSCPSACRGSRCRPRRRRQGGGTRRASPAPARPHAVHLGDESSDQLPLRRAGVARAEPGDADAAYRVAHLERRTDTAFRAQAGQRRALDREGVRTRVDGSKAHTMESKGARSDGRPADRGGALSIGRHRGDGAPGGGDGLSASAAATPSRVGAPRLTRHVGNLYFAFLARSEMAVPERYQRPSRNPASRHLNR